MNKLPGLKTVKQLMSKIKTFFNGAGMEMATKLRAADTALLYADYTDTEILEHHTFGKRLVDHDAEELIDINDCTQYLFDENNTFISTLVSTDGYQESECTPHIVPRHFVDFESLISSGETHVHDHLKEKMTNFMALEENVEALTLGKLLPISDLSFTVSMYAEMGVYAIADVAFNYEKDLLAWLQDKIASGFSSGSVPILPPLVTMEFSFRPKISMPVKFRAQMIGMGKIAIIAKDTMVSVNIFGGKVKAKPPNFTDSYLRATGSVQANIGVQIYMSAQASLKLCFVSVCMGLTAKAEEEAAFGADAGLGTATSGGGLLDVPDPVAFVGPPPPPPPPPPRNGMGEDKYKAVHCTKNVDTSATTKTGEFDLKTWYSQYTDYTKKDLMPYKKALKNAYRKGGLILGLGFWYYVTIPSIKIYVDKPLLLQSALEKSMPLEYLFNSVASGTFRSMSMGDKTQRKMDREERLEESFNHHPLTSAKTPYMIRNTFAMGKSLVIPFISDILANGGPFYFFKQIKAPTGAAEQRAEVAKEEETDNEYLDMHEIPTDDEFATRTLESFLGTPVANVSIYESYESLDKMELDELTHETDSELVMRQEVDDEAVHEQGKKECTAGAMWRASLQFTFWAKGKNLKYGVETSTKRGINMGFTQDDVTMGKLLKTLAIATSLSIDFVGDEDVWDPGNVAKMFGAGFGSMTSVSAAMTACRAFKECPMKEVEKSWDSVSGLVKGSGGKTYALMKTKWRSALFTHKGSANAWNGMLDAWMGDIKKKDLSAWSRMRLRDLFLIHSHDAGCNKAEMMKTLNLHTLDHTAVTQYSNVWKQLEAGARSFDLRFQKRSAGKWHIHHGQKGFHWYFASAEKITGQIQTFCRDRKHWDEIIFMRVKCESKSCGTLERTFSKLKKYFLRTSAVGKRDLGDTILGEPAFGYPGCTIIPLWMEESDYAASDWFPANKEYFGGYANTREYEKVVEKLEEDAKKMHSIGKKFPI